MSIRIENMLTDSLIEQMPQYITLTSNDMQENQKEVLNLVREYSTLKIILDNIAVRIKSIIVQLILIPN